MPNNEGGIKEAAAFAIAQEGGERLIRLLRVHAMIPDQLEVRVPAFGEVAAAGIGLHVTSAVFYAPPRGLIGVYFNRLHRRLLFIFNGVVTGGTLMLQAEEIAEIGWFAPDTLPLVNAWKARQVADVYDLIYDAERPELFMKDAQGRRTSGPDEPIAARTDARWTVPEPELAVVLGDDGRPLAVTIGNDVSSRDIEGANPLYLPQAKIYARACALGPALLVPVDWSVPFDIELRILGSDGAIVFEGHTSTDRMRRPLQTLVEFLRRGPNLPVLLLVLYGLFSWHGSSSAAFSRSEWLRLACGAGLYFVAAGLPRRDQVHRVVTALICVAAVSALYRIGGAGAAAEGLVRGQGAGGGELGKHG